MTSVLLGLHITIAIVMVGIILIQKTDGGGALAGMGGGNMGGLMSSRGTANLLTRMTAVLAALFFLSTLGLAILFKGANKPKSILDTPTTSAPVNSQSSESPNPASAQKPLSAPLAGAAVSTPKSTTTLPSESSPKLPKQKAQK